MRKRSCQRLNQSSPEPVRHGKLARQGPGINARKNQLRCLVSGEISKTPKAVETKHRIAAKTVTFGPLGLELSRGVDLDP